ncbi:hypothetical protein LCGC14_0578920 [marine sediment metagenome]|uniref:Uncharacterized protein n=1 Tax=marine sediment metagenome TaxID=412755 RepID=A0A0F9RH46_9ZZZZ
MQDIDNFAGNNSPLHSELGEKNRLLEQIAERIQTINTRVLAK